MDDWVGMSYPSPYQPDGFDGSVVHQDSVIVQLGQDRPQIQGFANQGV